MEAVEAEAAPRRDRRMSVFAGMREYLARRTFALGAAAVLVIGLLSWKVLLQEHLPGPDGPSRRRPDRASRPAGPGGSNHSSSRSVGSAGSQCGGVTSIDENRVNLVVEDMRSVPENQTCQIWVIHDDVPTPSGLFDPGGNMTAAAVTTSIEKADAIAVTVEPAGSSEKPTGEPVLLTKL
jgi:anti-sigma-K factor RskA